MNSTCSTGGSHRRRHSLRKRRTRTMKGGMGYGFGGTIGTAGPVWDSAWGGEITKAGAPVYDTADPQRGSGRRRTQKKKKVVRRRRTMKGGMSVAHSSAGFTGQGERGLATFKDVGSSTKFANDVVPLA